MGPDVPAVAIARLRSTWDDEVRPSSRRALLALAFATAPVRAEPNLSYHLGQLTAAQSTRRPCAALTASTGRLPSSVP